MKLILFAALMLFSFLPFQTGAETIAPGEALTLQRAIQIALKNQPVIAAGTSKVRAGEARIGQARSNYFPQVNATGDYTRGTTPGSNDPDDYYSSAISLDQILYDFGRTSSQVSIEKFNTRSAQSDLQDTTDQVVFDVKQAYYNLLQAEQARMVAREAVAQFEKHLEQARGFFEVGTKPRFDVTQAEVDLSNARLSLIRAENEIRLTRATLDNAMGLRDTPDYRLQDTLSFVKYELPFEEAVTRAEAQRPDLQSLLFRESAARESISLARKGYLPTLTGGARYNLAGSRFPLDRDWDYGLTLHVPLFNGLLTRYQVAEARANTDTLHANTLTLRQDILLQLQRGYIALRDAAESIQNTELTVRQAKENLELATGRYEAGVGSPIEVTDAVVAYSNAQLAYSRSLYQYKIARAAIERSIGERS